eukprot:g2019.t1
MAAADPSTATKKGPTAAPGLIAGRITRDLIKKKSEHNDGILDDLEELSLHQLELERIEVVGHLCRKLKILYLQNNIIPRIENLHHCKDLQYLNLALNNILKIEGLRNCEFLNKLDLTVNFISFEHFEESMDHLANIPSLRELFLMGNPITDWEPWQDYAVIRLPQLTHLDGKEITRSVRILAQQNFAKAEKELRKKAAKERADKPYKPPPEEDEYCPELRTEMYREEFEQKQEQEKKRDHMKIPERDYAKEHAEHVEKVREEEKGHMSEKERAQAAAAKAKAAIAKAKADAPGGKLMDVPDDGDGGDGGQAESKAAAAAAAAATAAGGEGDEERGPAGSGATFTMAGRVRQCNQGKYDFKLYEEGKDVILEVELPRFLATSLINVDVQPTYVSVVIKKKVLRLEFPAEVNPDRGKCQRSTTTGTLTLTLPRADNKKVLKSFVDVKKEKEAQRKAEERAGRVKRVAAPSKLGDQLQAAAAAAAGAAAAGGDAGGGAATSKAVRLQGIVNRKPTAAERDAGTAGTFDSSKELRAVGGTGAAAGGDGGGVLGAAAAAAAAAATEAPVATSKPAQRPAQVAGSGHAPPPLDDL